ncbi:MAG TPA: hypothetical protein VIS06_11545 [Mycobacteriales bacterium]
MSGDLEGRYRRLLAWYPVRYRHTYEEEMLGVLLAGARPQQRYPRPGETLNLLRTALWMRMGRTVGGPLDSRWRDAAAVFGLLVPVVLVTQGLGSMVGRWVLLRRLGAPTNVLPTADWPLTPGASVRAWVLAGWLLVTALTLCGWRVVAAVLAWAVVLAEAYVLILRYHTSPVGVLHAAGLFVLTATIAATLSVRAPARRALTVLGRRRVILLGTALTAAAGLPALDALLANVAMQGPVVDYRVDVWSGSHYLSTSGFWFGMGSGPLNLVAFVLLAATVLTAFVGISAPVRRRLLALSVPVVALAVVIRLGFGGFVDSSARFSHPVLLVPGQWVTLIATPLVAFLVSVALVHRRERRAHLIQLGEVAERQLLLSEPADLR